jgi:hypothetical protein
MARNASRDTFIGACLLVRSPARSPRHCPDAIEVRSKAFADVVFATPPA